MSEFLKCNQCEVEAIPDLKSCEYHLNKSKERQKKQYYLKKQQGLCLYCKKNTLPYKLFCFEHWEKHKTRDKILSNLKKIKRKQNGCCVSCSNKLHVEFDSSRITCVNCRERRR